MNRWIAGVFASIVSFIHWGVLIFLIVVALIIFENKNAYYTTILGYSFTKEMSFIFLIAFFIGYVLVMGFCRPSLQSTKTSNALTLPWIGSKRVNAIVLAIGRTIEAMAVPHPERLQ